MHSACNHENKIGIKCGYNGKNKETTYQLAGKLKSTGTPG